MTVTETVQPVTSATYETLNTAVHSLQFGSLENHVSASMMADVLQHGCGSFGFEIRDRIIDQARRAFSAKLAAPPAKTDYPVLSIGEAQVTFSAMPFNSLTVEEGGELIANMLYHWCGARNAAQAEEVILMAMKEYAISDQVPGGGY